MKAPTGLVTGSGRRWELLLADHPTLATYVDTLGLWLDPHPRAARRARRLRRLARSLGLRPGPLHQQTGRSLARLQRLDGLDLEEGVGFRCTLGPLWRRGVDLEARARGETPRDVLALLRAAQDAAARVYRLDLALDLLGCPADLAASVLAPSLALDWISTLHDFVHLRGAPTRWHRDTDHATSYVGHASDAVSVACYTDRPSKLEPDGPPVFHCEVRVTGDDVPQLFRDHPRSVLDLLQPHVFVRALARFVEPGILSPHSLETLTSKAARVRAVVTDATSRSGACRLSAEKIAQLAGCTERHARRVLASLQGDSVRVLQAGGGRGRATVRTLRHA